LALSAGALAALPGAASAAVPTDWVADGPVYSITHGGGQTFVGGDFTHVGPRTGHGVSLNPATGAWNGGAEVAGGQVRAAISDGSGGWYIGGDFTYVGGQPRRGLAHIKPTGEVDEGFVANVENSGSTPASVRALYLYTDGAGNLGDLYVGGAFTKVDRPALAPGDPAKGTGQGLANLAAVDRQTGKPAAWNPQAATDTNGTAAGATVNALTGMSVVQPVDDDGTDANKPIVAHDEWMPIIFVGGEFTFLGVQPPGATAKLQADRLGAVWGVGAKRSQAADTPLGIGAMTVASRSGTAWKPIGTSAGVTVRTVALGTVKPPADSDVDKKLTVAVYAGGDGPLAGTSRPVGAWKFQIKQAGATTAGDLPTPAPSAYTWDPRPVCDPVAVCAAPSVRALTISDGVVYFGGDFNKVHSSLVVRERIAAFPVIPDPDPTGTPPASPVPFDWNPSLDGMVRGLSISDGSVFVAGDFKNALGQPRGGLAALNTALDPSSHAANVAALREQWKPQPTGGRVDTGGGIANAVATGASGAPVFAGGSFTSVGAPTRNRLAAFDASGDLSDWDPNVGCTPEPCEVRALDFADGRVFAGGDFDTIGTKSHANLAAIDADTGAAPESWDHAPAPNWDVLALSHANGKVYIGGAFDKVGTDARNRLAAVDAATGALDASFNPGAATAAPGANDHVRAISASCDRVIVGGSFTKVGNVNRNRIASLNPDTGAVHKWNPDAQGTVYDIERDGDTVYAAGQFALIGGALRQKIAALNVNTGKATDWNPSADATVRAIAISQDDVFAGGIFREIGGESRSRMAAISRATGDATAFRGEADVDAVVYAADVQGTGAVFGGSFRQVNETAAHSLAGFGQLEAEPVDPCAPPPAPPTPDEGTGDDAPPPPPPVQDPETAAKPSDPPPPPPPPAAAADVAPPVVAFFKLAPRAFPARSVTVLRWQLSEEATYRIVISRLHRGRGGKLRAKRIGVLTGTAPAGVSKLALRGRVGRRVLQPGLYRAQLVAVDAANNAAAPKVVRFQVKPRKQPAARRTRRN
jgi:hypothetical protein